MKLIVCLDDRNGMLFGGKRQSRDRVVCEKILVLTDGTKLWMNHYSAKLFSDKAETIFVDDNFLDCVADEDFCFVEDRDVTPYIDKIDQIVLFKWNRHYPADRHFCINMTAPRWKLLRTETFSGNAHEKVTMEVYVR